MKIRGSFQVTKWDEHSYQEISPTSRLTKASVEYQCTGDIEGTAVVEYLMYYRYFDPKDPHRSSADYVGLIRFDGQIQGKAGSFVMQDEGSFRDGVARSALTIAPGSGTATLQGIGGTGMYRADKKERVLELDCVLP